MNFLIYDGVFDPCTCHGMIPCPGSESDSPCQNCARFESKYVAAAMKIAELEDKLRIALEEARHVIESASPILNNVLDEGNWDGDRWASTELDEARDKARAWLEKYGVPFSKEDEWGAK